MHCIVSCPLSLIDRNSVLWAMLGKSIFIKWTALGAIIWNAEVSEVGIGVKYFITVE